MSIARPQNRDEFRQYVLTKLGAPVIEINVAEEQIDIAIEDAFQYFNERSHFLGTERMYLTTRMTPEFIANFSSMGVQDTSQTGSPNAKVPIPGRPTVSGPGMVAELTLVSSGSGYAPNAFPLTNVGTTDVTASLPITTDSGSDLTNELGDSIVYQTDSSGEGKNLTVTIGPERTIDNGITNVSIYGSGIYYKVGEIVSIKGNQSANVKPGETAKDALFEVSKVKTESPVFGRADIQIQNNYVVLPNDVIGVNGVLRSVSTDLIGVFPGGSIFPLILGGMLGNDAQCGNSGYDLVSYVSMREYMSTLEFLFFPPIQYNFNTRTHRLFLDTNNFKTRGAYNEGMEGAYLCLDCMVKPSPDVYPDLWNDYFIKEMSVALVKAQWGRNITKYNSVSLPGGISMNGAQILADARQDLAELKQRFALDYADPPLDLVG